MVAVQGKPDETHAGGGNQRLFLFHQIARFAEIDHRLHAKLCQGKNTLRRRLSAPVEMLVDLVEVRNSGEKVRPLGGGNLGEGCC
jgi:hypothetical protein